MAADYGEFAAVGGPAEAAANMLGSEIGDLSSGIIVKGLQPEIVNVPGAYRIYY
jgi:hypothetical protein